MQPNPVEFIQPIDLVVDFSQVSGFDEVRYEIADDTGRVEEERTVPRSEGQVSGTVWTLHNVFDTDDNPGVYTVVVWLVDDGVKKSRAPHRSG